jgi:hypothetical protein
MRKLLALSAAVLLSAAACSDGGTGPSAEANIAGNYTLQTVNGNPLPWRPFVVGNDFVEITSGSGTVNADNTYSLRIDVRTSVDGQITMDPVTEVGTWTRNGNNVSFRSSDGSVANGTVTGNQISLTDQDGFVLVFRKT